MPGVRELATPHHTRRFAHDVVVADRTVLRVTADVGHIRVSLVMPGIDRSVEITASPGSAVHALNEAAERAGVPLSQVHAQALGCVDDAAREAGAWLGATTNDSLLARLGGGAFAMLGAAYEWGAQPVSNVPSWALDALRATDPRSAARSLFGDQATRPVGVAFARSLVRVDAAPVDFSRIGLALMGASVLQPDHLAEVLVAPGAPWPTNALPTPSLLVDAQRVVRLWGPAHTRDYLLQGALDDQGRRAFIDCLTFAGDLGPHAPIRLPGSLVDLVDVYRTHVRTNVYAPVTRLPRIDQRLRDCTDVQDPTESRVRGAQTPPRDVHVAPGHRLEAPNYGMRHAPRVGADVTVTPNSVIPHPAWLRHIDGTTFLRYTFVLPRTCRDLTRWSRVMHNCLDSFGRAAMAGESHLVGVMWQGSLRYVIEINRDRRIRQFSGRSNRVPDVREHDAIVAQLRTREVLV